LLSDGKPAGTFDEVMATIIFYQGRQIITKDSNLDGFRGLKLLSIEIDFFHTVSFCFHIEKYHSQTSSE
jgi:hypothetical protein